jgi:hypothetical protein
MDGKFEHLDLPAHDISYSRAKKPGGGGYGNLRTYSQRKEFFDIQIEQFETIKNEYKKDKERYKEYYEPHLIFKLSVNQDVNEDTFRLELNRMYIEVISPSPDKKGLWIVFTEDGNVKEFYHKLRKYVDKGSYKFFDAIDTIAEIPPEDKLGDRLKNEMLKDNEYAFLDLEIWRMEDEKLNKFIDGLKKLINTKDGKITDKFIKDNFCLLRIKANKQIVEDLLRLREIAFLDRPPNPYIEYNMLTLDIDESVEIKAPPQNASAIGILDSGIISNHPLLKNSVGDEIAISTLYSNKIDPNKPQDDVGHGTQVAGIALYGDLKERISKKNFNSEVWLLSAKIMHGEKNPGTGKLEAVYDNEEKLLEHQLEKAVRYFIENYQNCKVINLSLGNSDRKMFGQKRQFNLSTLIDELTKELGLIFVISIGNLNDYNLDDYPAYLLEETSHAKVIEPATAALGITVVSITQNYGPSVRYPQDIFYSPAKTNYPSPFTRVGPGYKGMIKPELVEEGGNVITDKNTLEDIGGKLITLNYNWIKEGKLFSLDHGTSLSAPKVAHYIALLYNHYPSYSSNLIKALLISSARIPDSRPEPLDKITFKSSEKTKEVVKLLNIYGYGKPDLYKAMYSSSSEVLLLKENRIKLDGIAIYSFYLPEEFIKESGIKTLSVTLVYDPPINKNRIDYMGCNMEFHLFKDKDIGEVIYAYKAIKIEDLDPENEITPENIKLQEIKLKPGVKFRKKGVHQKGIIIDKKKPNIDINKPVVLVVICKNRWIKEKDYLQDYAVIVNIEHSGKIDLYNKVKAKNQQRIRVKGKF